MLPQKETRFLLPQHAARIAASGITPEVAAARGYRSITDPADALTLGFADYQAIVPALLVPVHGVDGQIVLHQLRPDNPRINKEEKPIKYETPAGSHMRLDVPPAVLPILADPSVPLIITEGAKKADAAVSAGGHCIALLGVWGWRGTNVQGDKGALADWDSIALNGRRIYLCFDSDVMVKESVRDALDALTRFLQSRGAIVRHIYLPATAEGGKRGLDDFLATNHTMEDVYALARDAPTEDTGGTSPRQSKRPPQRDDLIDLAADAELFHDPQGIPYATFVVGSHRETHRLTSRGFKEWLAHRYYREHGGSANSQAVQDACTALAGRARYDGPDHPVFIRLAEQDGVIYLDLCDAAWRVVEIDADGWRIVTDAPVRFRRTKGMLALPTPDDGGTLVTLRRFFNLPDADWVLIVAWLIAAFRPRGPYPILGFRGEQGSAKSTRARMLRSLVDPNAAALRTMPRDERDLMIAATNSWTLALDNISTLPPWISDALCRLSTGGGFATRELYADEDETILDAQRPLILNGISDFATRSDLLDRLIGIDLPRIPDDERQSEEALWLAFEQARPAILGALLSAASMAIRNLPTTHLDAMPRMADFALWVTAAAPALGWQPDTFLDAYAVNRAGTHEFIVEASPFAATLIEFVKNQREPWEGRASALLAALNERADEATRKQRGWPADATRLSSDLRRIAPNLRAIGLAVEWGRSKRARTVRLEWTNTPHEEERGETASPASPDGDKASNTKQTGGDAGGDAGDAGVTLHNATASSHEGNCGKGNDAGDAGDAGDAEKPSRSSRTSRRITDRDLPNIFPGHREAATND